MKAYKLIVFAGLFSLLFPTWATAQSQIRIQLGTQNFLLPSTPSPLLEQDQLRTFSQGGLRLGLAKEITLRKHLFMEWGGGITSSLPISSPLTDLEERAKNPFPELHQGLLVQGDLGTTFKIELLGLSNLRLVTGGHFQVPLMTRYSRIGGFVQIFDLNEDNQAYPQADHLPLPLVDGFLGVEYAFGRGHGYTFRWEIGRQVPIGGGAIDRLDNTDFGMGGMSGSRFSIGFPIRNVKP